jgi:hypothetical protein
MNRDDFHWLVGLLEGEGCFQLRSEKRRYKSSAYEYWYPKIILRMTDRDVVERAAGLLGCKSIHQRANGVGCRDSFEFSLSGSRAVKFMRDAQPFFGERRQAKIAEILAGTSASYLAKIAVLGRV